MYLYLYIIYDFNKMLLKLDQLFALDRNLYILISNQK